MIVTDTACGVDTSHFSTYPLLRELPHAATQMRPETLFHSIPDLLPFLSFPPPRISAVKHRSSLRGTLWQLPVGIILQSDSVEKYRTHPVLDQLSTHLKHTNRISGAVRAYRVRRPVSTSFPCFLLLPSYLNPSWYSCCSTQTSRLDRLPFEDQSAHITHHDLEQSNILSPSSNPQLAIPSFNEINTHLATMGSST
jgi:hypothetical protein